MRSRRHSGLSRKSKAIVFAFAFWSWFLISARVLAAGEQSGNHEIPWTLITAQSVNFVIVIGVLIFIAVKVSRTYFVKRADHFRQLVKQAEDERRQAELKLQEFEKRLADLRTSSATSVENARVEARQLKQQLQQEAESLSKTINQEAVKSALLEVERAKRVLTAQLLENSVEKARQEMSVKDQDHKRLKNEFVQKIQVVHS